MKYKNITDRELVMPQVGVIAPEAEFESDLVIENPNIQVVSQKLEETAEDEETKQVEPKIKIELKKGN